MALDSIREAACALRRLILYRGVLAADPALRALAGLVRALADPERFDADRLWDRASELAWRLAEPGDEGEGHGHPGMRDPVGEGGACPWHCRVVEAVLGDDNPFTRSSARAGGTAAVSPALRETAAHDLRHLQRLARLSVSCLAEALAERGVPWPPAAWSLVPRRNSGAGCGRDSGRWWARTADRVRPHAGLVGELCEQLQATRDWGEAVGQLVRYHQLAGAGAVARFVALVWRPAWPDCAAGPTWAAGPSWPAGLVPAGRTAQATRPASATRSRGRLAGVARPDPVRLEQLVGYEEERRRVVVNTERFVSGLPAHHLLLYGPRGTGKSATVKALVHAFADRGLRLVELPRAHLGDLREVLCQLEAHPQRFILFLDDLSLSPGDPELAVLKAAIEGTVEPWPPNVRVYATSNRRHLVEERPQPEGLARPMDEVHERLALADRFGVTILFLSPDQELYLRIVEGLAAQAGIRVVDRPDAAGPEVQPEAVPIDRASLRQQALWWARWHNECSPRSAVQFIGDLAARLVAQGRLGPSPVPFTPFPAIDGRKLPGQDGT